jgi:hypothetical protein
MLTRVDIANYRGFKSYQMQGLAQVNLLVGKNNSGKTALLEGLQFLTSGGDPVVLSEVAQRRGEVIIARPEPTSQIEIGHFFNGHSVGPDSNFSIRGDNGYPGITVKVVELRRPKETGESGEAPPGRPLGFALKIDGGRPREREERVFRITREGGVDFELGPRSRRFPVPRRIEGSSVRFISTEFFDSAMLAQMWDEVTVNGLDHEVGEALRVLDREVRSVHMLSGMFAFGYVGSRAGVVLGIADQKTRVPLGSMGDGMRRLLVLATSLACASGGVLLVDEVDTGLHFSVMSDMWKLVIRRATEAGIQVFATTHSWDCIEGLSQLCQREPDLLGKVAVHTIDRKLPHSVAFAGDSIVRMVKHQIDPR